MMTTDKIKTQTFIERFGIEIINSNVWIDSYFALYHKERNRDLKTCHKYLKILNDCIETSIQFNSTHNEKLRIDDLIKCQAVWKELKKRRIKKLFSLDFILFNLTFIGVIIHELSHYLTCKAFGVRVYWDECVFFSNSIDFIDNKKYGYGCFDNTYGFVIHQKTDKYREKIWISVSPLISGTILSLICFLLFPIIDSLPLKFLLFWVGFSIAYNALPSTIDTGWINNPKPNIIKTLKDDVYVSNYITLLSLPLWRCTVSMKESIGSRILFSTILFIVIKLFWVFGLSFLIIIVTIIILYIYDTIKTVKKRLQKHQ